MTDARVIEIWNEMVQPNWLPISAGNLGPVRKMMTSFFDAYGERSEDAFRSALSWVAASEWWKEQQRVTLSYVANKDKLLKYAEMYGVGDVGLSTPEQITSRILAAKSGVEIEDVLRHFRPDGSQPVWINEVPYAVKFAYDEEYMTANPGRFRILDVKLIKAGDTVLFHGRPSTVERIVKHDLLAVKDEDRSALVSPYNIEVV